MGKIFDQIITNSIGEARGYVFKGIYGAQGYRVIFVELIRYNKDWRVDSNGYTQCIIASHGETVVNCNSYGVFSPYPMKWG